MAKSRSKQASSESMDQKARRIALNFLNSDYDPRLDPKKTSLCERIYWVFALWMRERKVSSLQYEEFRRLRERIKELEAENKDLRERLKKGG